MAEDKITGSKTPRQKLRRAVDPDTHGKSIRNRLFSAAPGDSGFFTPRAFGSSKLMRGFRNKGLDGSPIASQEFSCVLLDNPNVVNLLRTDLAASFDIFCEVFLTRKAKSNKSKFLRTNVVLKNGKLSLKPQELGSPTRTGRAEVHVHCIVSLKLEKDKKLVSFKAWLKGRGKENRVDSLSTFHIRAGSEDQAEFIAETLMIECENYATVIDINLGSWNLYGTKEKYKEHLGSLIRKRYDLFCCSKLEGSSAKMFALSQLINHLKENDGAAEAKYWEMIEKEGGGSLALLKKSSSHGLKDLQFQRHDSFKNRVSQLKESIESLFVGSEDKSDVEITDSYYVSQFKKGALAESD